MGFFSPSQPRLARLPRCISHWLGHRESPPAPRQNYLVWFWSFIGAFCGISILQAVFGHAQYFMKRSVPSIIASYGASAVLCYGAIEAPLAQPRALVGGHFIGALIGICITKLFSLLPTQEQFESLRWLAGSLSVAVAIVAMQITETTHPPAGATALLAAVDDDVVALSWYYLPVVLLSSMLVLVSALIINNIQRRYPVYWFVPVVPAKSKPPPEETSASDSMTLGNGYSHAV
ncbi:HPP family protein [Stereum hirsutum FP-91666 SS1]|uniref:HPP family protein n=1 Tax=Stereum hirsutum (strain FP-91666) TaxID=721885 RepID=UPI000440C02E|nr:HPP family protein [Stereum hirsutum FP-91666 SS1]EIM87986.1 HPP family protein [Stereum hirsutum FP-91666 SS1]